MIWHPTPIHLRLRHTTETREGLVLHFTDLKAIVETTLQLLDHTLLNDIEGLSNPTAEILTVWIWKRLKPLLAGLQKIELKETPGNGVIYEGE